MKIISEKDLYKFVFYPDDLPEEIHNYISVNEDKYKSDLNFLRDMKKNLSEQVPQSIMDRIYDKIADFERNNEIVLEKVEQKKDNDYVVFAADSDKKIPAALTETFIDKNKQYLIKVVSNKDKSRIFVFSPYEHKNQEFKMSINPQGKSFNIDLAEMPLEIKRLNDIKNIVLSSQDDF